jgi:hypothetical protein
MIIDVSWLPWHAFLILFSVSVSDYFSGVDAWTNKISELLECLGSFHVEGGRLMTEVLDPRIASRPSRSAAPGGISLPPLSSITASQTSAPTPPPLPSPSPPSSAYKPALTASPCTPPSPDHSPSCSAGVWEGVGRTLEQSALRKKIRVEEEGRGRWAGRRGRRRWRRTRRQWSGGRKRRRVGGSAWAV